MATFTAARLTKLLYNGYDLSSYFKEASVPKSSDVADVTTFGEEAVKRLGTLRDGSFNASGFLDETTAGGAGEVLSAALGSDGNEVSIYNEGDAIGKFGNGLQVSHTSHEVSAPVGGGR